ncbi:MAG: aldo/keto reductase [Frankiaceae bacterium]|jgi:aryl-alcohol dehydrogenase-like predicted oxidoreductase|nr:aldo/keto reductase [Frankiaceae bacterium]
MRYVKLGSTGLDVSPVCLGALNFGEPHQGVQTWSLDAAATRPLIRRALDAGINFFDTANVYSAGTSEEILGAALKDMADRDDIVIATKVHGAMRAGRPNGAGLSRKAIMTEVEHSLRRLQVDYIDLYQPHRWDPNTPIEETLEALHDLVKSGKVRYIGASSMAAWQFSKAQYLAERHGWTRFATMQNHYNLIYREEEREMLPLCLDQGVGVIPWSPLARGRLTRDWAAQTDRSRLDARMGLYDEEDQLVADQVQEVAEARGVPRAQVALAWVMRHPAVSAPIIGASKPSHIDDAVAAADIQLSDDEAELLERHYIPHDWSA